MEWDNLDDSEIDQFIGQLRDEFRLRSINDLGGILHMIAFELMFSATKIDPRSADEIVASYKAYLEDLISDDKFPEVTDPSDYSGGYKGFSYWVVEESREEFNGFFSSLTDYVSRAWCRRSPQTRKELLLALEAGADEFLAKLSAGSLFASVPVLNSMSASEFVGVMLKLHPREWGSIAKALQKRKSYHAHDKSFQMEAEWFELVLKTLELRMQESEPIRRAKIGRVIAWMKRT